MFNATKIHMLVSHSPRASLPGLADEALNVGANITFSETMKQHFVNQCISDSLHFKSCVSLSSAMFFSLVVSCLIFLQ